MTDDRKYPRYQMIDGIRQPASFHPECIRETLRYQPADDDLFIVSFPKSGTTWTQMVVHLLLHDGNPPANEKELFRASPFLEKYGLEGVRRMARPGAIKVHLPYELTPQSSKAKYIVVLRNPKDVCVSFFHHTQSRCYCFENGDFETFFEIFLNGDNDVGDYFDFHLSWYEHRDDPNVLFVYYEDMKGNLGEQVLRMADFINPVIGRNIRADSALFNKIIDNASLKSMKKLNSTFNDPFADIGGRDVDLSKLDISKGLKYSLQFAKDNGCMLPQVGSEMPKTDFIRKGIVGDWRNMFSEAQNESMNKKIEQKMGDTDMYRFWKKGGFL